MKLYNVKLSVVTLTRAEDPDDAVASVRSELSRFGFDVYEGDAPDVFESEDVPDA